MSLYWAIAWQLSWRPVLIGRHNSDVALLARAGYNARKLNRRLLYPAVTAVAVAHDGNVAASSDNRGIVKLWDVPHHRLLRTLPDTAEPQVAGNDDYHSLLFLPDNKTLATGNWNYARQVGRVQLWNVTTGKLCGVIHGVKSMALWLAAAPNGKMIATAGWTETAQLWDLTSLRPRSPLRGAVKQAGETECMGAAFSPDGLTLVVGRSSFVGGVRGCPGTVQFWNATTGDAQRAIDAHSDRVTTVAISPDGRVVASGAEDSTIGLWDARNGQALLPLIQVHGSVTDLSWSPDGRSLASSGDSVRLWSFPGGRLLRTLDGAGVNMVFAWMPDGRSGITGDASGNVKLWRIE